MFLPSNSHDTDCNCDEPVTDSDYRRGVHLTKKWSCKTCTSSASEPLVEEKEENPYEFEDKIAEAFDELMGWHAPNLCDSYCGTKVMNMGEGYLALPTLIHCGPGNPSTEPRYVLFFTLRPRYNNIKFSAIEKHKYDPNTQYHAGKFCVVIYGVRVCTTSLLSSPTCPSLGAILMHLSNKKEKQTAKLNQEYLEKLKDVKAVYVGVNMDFPARIESLHPSQKKLGPSSVNKKKPKGKPKRKFTEKAKCQKCAWVICGRAIDCGGFTQDKCKIFGVNGIHKASKPSLEDIDHARKKKDAERKRNERKSKAARELQNFSLANR